MYVMYINELLINGFLFTLQLGMNSKGVYRIVNNQTHK